VALVFALAGLAFALRTPTALLVPRARALDTTIHTRWFDDNGRPTDDMRDVLHALRRAADDGLDPDDYLGGLPSDLDRWAKNRSESPEALARLDPALTARMLRYLRDLHAGRIDPRTIGLRLESPRDQRDFEALLDGAIAAHRVSGLIADLRPPLAQYGLLRSMLARYRSLAADSTIITPRYPGHSIHPGESFAEVETLQRFLAALGDMPANAPSSERQMYGGAIVDSVKRFQTRHGLTADGVLGRSTIAAIRVPLTWRVRQIELALERLRWLPPVGGHRLIALNIPMFRLWAWDAIPPSGAPLFGMDAIVGRAPRTQTPVFVEEMREVIFRPFWNVPRSILLHEVLPRIQRDPEYLSREDMEIVRGAGDDAAGVRLTADAVGGLRRGTLRLRQRPGPRNALGLIKFVFPNDQDVYMHGTPEHSLFARNRRDFSHGCVRVADPITLAEWVLQDQPEWTRDRIFETANGTQTIRVRLQSPIQVILFYTTAAVMPEEGTIHFADDIYQQDARLDRALSMRRLDQ
jgi:murein L,D-transpeptidase YcbB/YkuD